MIDEWGIEERDEKETTRLKTYSHLSLYAPAELVPDAAAAAAALVVPLYTHQASSPFNKVKINSPASTPRKLQIVNTKALHVIATTPNPEAICPVSPLADSSYLAYPPPVPPSTTPLATATSTGSILATSSEKGTVIRVWSIPGAEKLFQFRRGAREARIYSINFNVVSSLLSAARLPRVVISHLARRGRLIVGRGCKT
ncbi:hypothetical protein K443DRAFT_124788 [Laccaria amethystina LaAM-08-1]|uniref:Uncharacterized protein n=1 Tax=Laccaria amethystina LaAM-08-1 TaxID=1095629 RepID=A0A0C9XHG9_9AGAR|nr:hypothetical protein K443DRAFT_124788 [Laccaria amethystina LaAM-08-1]